jgi:Domain of Unknown Function (DUF1080)
MTNKRTFSLGTGLLLLTTSLFSQALTKPEATEVWEPEPRVVTPAKQIGQAPSDATILFDGTALNAWVGMDGQPARWTVEGGIATVAPGTGDIRTKDSFGDCQLHIEWRSPIESDTLKGQAKGNSGVFFQNRYEVQILNSFNNKTYSNGQAACIYKQHPPLVNACAPMGEWNAYDIIYIAPRFRANGSLETPGNITVLHNGIVAQYHAILQGTTEYIGAPKVEMHGNGPIKLQDHSNKVSYRNIWIRPIAAK